MGTRKKHILKLFVSEGLIVGVVGGIAGIAVGALLAAIISALGIPMPPAPGMSHGFTAEIFVSQKLIVEAFALAAFTAVTASLYPAIKASRLDIVDALRHNH